MNRLQTGRLGIEQEGGSGPSDHELRPTAPKLVSTATFYTEVNARLRPDMAVLNLGAGRGAGFERSVSPHSSLPHETGLVAIRGKVRRYVGADPDHTAISQNMHVDERVPIEVNKPLPFSDGEFDLIISDWVLEHVTDPAFYAKEVARVLKQGGWFCARTPNRWGVVPIAASVIPPKLHRRVLRRVAPHRREEDIFPTVYRINTRSKIRQYFPSSDWIDHSFMMNGRARYFNWSPMLSKLVLTYWRVAPDSLKSIMLVFLQKK
jgi:SAM-dependent methyltransferase